MGDTARIIPAGQWTIFFSWVTGFNFTSCQFWGITLTHCVTLSHSTHQTRQSKMTEQTRRRLSTYCIFTPLTVRVYFILGAWRGLTDSPLIRELTVVVCHSGTFYLVEDDPTRMSGKRKITHEKGLVKIDRQRESGRKLVSGQWPRLSNVHGAWRLILWYPFYDINYTESNNSILQYCCWC